MTEDEAKKKWCPFAETSFMPISCLGSACMAWRDNRVPAHGLAYHLRIADSEDDARRSLETWCAANPIHGYCGLAGKPE